MPTLSFTGVLLVAVLAFLAPIGASLIPGVRVPSLVLELVAGIIIGPSGFGWAHVDLPLHVLSLLGLAFLLFLAGLEVEFDRLQGHAIRIILGAFVLSLGIALIIGFGLNHIGVVRSPLFIAIVLTATALGIVVPLLTDAGKGASTFGQVIIAAASLADFGTVVLLSLFFSRAATSIGARLILLGGFVTLTLISVLAIFRIDRIAAIRRVLVRLQDTTAQIRIRGAFLLLTAFVALAQGLGLEVILGAFTAGAVLRFIDRDAMLLHPQLRQKLGAAGFGIFIPIFFITSGMQLNLHAVFAHPTTVLLVPTFLLALFLVRGLPALLYVPILGKRSVLPAALLQATSLSFLVTAAQIGTDLGVMTSVVATALIMAGVLSVLIFPTVALRLLGSTPDLSSDQLRH